MYDNILEKKTSRLFEYSQVDQFDSLMGCLRRLDDAGYCFRGQRNALWEIQSSSQRAWNNWRCKKCITGAIGYQSYLSMSLEYAKRHVHFPECDLKCCKVGLRDHERWGYLQHYSWPTPLIDFTSNFRIALFMAVRSIPNSAVGGWFSIYAIRPEFEGGEENIDLDDFVESSGEDEYSFCKWHEKETFIMRKDAGHWCPEISKGRMASQGGLFVYLKSGEKSLEEIFAQKYLMDVGETDEVTEEHHRIICIDVPYTLVQEVKAYLMDVSICASLLGFQDDSIDMVMKTEYKKYERRFLQQCNILNSKIRIGANTYVRSCGDYVFFWNGRTGASRLINSAEALKECVGRKLNRWEDVAWGIAEKCQCPFAVAEEDYLPIVKDLAKDNLIEIEGRDRALMGINNKECGCESKHGDGRGCNDPDFFSLNRLPAELHIDLTSACTERCVHCYLPEYPNKHMPFPVAEKALRGFREMQGLTVYLTGGECMLHPDFKKICRLCKDLDLNMIIMSNMTLCDKEMVSFLREMDPQFVNVSLYSMNPEEHDAVTQVKRSWRKTMDAILACEMAGVHIRIATPLLKINRNAYGELKKFTDEHHMHLIPDFRICPKSNHDVCNLDYACNANELEAVLREYRELFNQGFDEIRQFAEDDRVCEVGDFRLCLNSKGEYYPCDGMHGYVLGNAHDNTLEEVWRGEKLEALRKLKNRDFGRCVSCEHRAFCKVCPAYNFNATGSLTETIPQHCETARIAHKVYGGKVRC